MKQKKIVLQAAVIAALISTPPLYFHVNEVFAADTSGTGAISGEYTLNVQSDNQKNEPDIDKKGNNITFTSTATAGQDMIKANEEKTLTIKGFHDLNFKDNLTDGTVNTALLASQGSNVTVQANTINFGTKDTVFKADQGFHAEGGTLTATADNIYGNVKASGFFMAQNWGGGQVGSLTVHANQDVNLTSTYAGLMTASIFHQLSDKDTNGKTKVITNSLTAGNKINLHVTGKGSSTAVVNLYDGNYGKIPKGDAHLTVSGAKGVSIISDYGIGIISRITTNTTADSNVGTTTITSNEGDVVIQAKQQAVYSFVKNNSTGNIDIVGNTIKLLSQDSKAISLSGNSQMTLGANKDQGMIQISGKETAASVGENSKLTIGDGKHDTFVNVTGQFDVSGGTVTVADKTTTVVDADSLGKKPLVSVSDGTFTAEDGAKLIVTGADTGDTLYTKEGEQSKVNFWNIKNTSFDNPFQYLSTDGKVLAGITDANKDSIAGYIVPAVAVAATGKNDKNITSLLTNGKDAWNSAVGIGQLGGIQHGTYAMTGLFTDALTDHDDTPDTDIWAKGFHSKESIDGLGFDGGALSMDAQYNGTVIGADVYQKQGKKAGVAMIYADGNVDGNNGSVYTKNNAKYLGASLYAQKTAGSYRLATDLSYLGGSHDLKQYNGNQTITAKPDTEAWTVGVKAMKDYDFTHGTLTPYVGFRYLRLTTDSYTSSLGLSYDKENQNIYLLPVGVDYAMYFNRGSWDIKPYAGLSYMWTMGDRNADQRVSYGSATDVFSYDVSDAGSFLGKVGVSATKGDYTFGLGYAYQTGSTTDSHTWIAQASYAF